MRRTIAAIGRTLVTLGLLILLFVTYSLWGTGIFTARAQSNLENTFNQKLDRIRDNPVVTAPPKSTPARPGQARPTTTINPATVLAPADGQPIGTIEIPKIGVDWVFVEGVRLEQLADGPGHYPGTPLPGQIGNAAIAGHRTTHGAPFFRLNELKRGDRIKITTFAGTFVYSVTRAPFTVDPKTGYHVVNNTLGPMLTLTTCHPRYSAAQRLIVKARLVRNVSSKPVKPPAVVNGVKVKAPQRAELANLLEGQVHSIVPSFVWGGIVAFVGAVWWYAFRRFRHPFTWAIGLVPFVAVLFPFFVFLERALPSGF